MDSKFCIQKKRLDLYFPEPTLGIETDEYGHVEINFEDELSRQIMIE